MCETCYELMKKRVNPKACIVYYGHKIPMTVFLRDLDGLAAGLLGLGLKRGDVVTIYLPTCPQSLAAFYACSKLGIAANIVHPLIPLKLLKENLKKVNSKALLFYDALVKDEKQLLELDQKLVRCSIADYVVARKPIYSLYAKAIGKRLKNISTYKKLCKCEPQSEVFGAAEDTVCFMHSGGTSGKPKIVKLSNYAVNQTAIGLQKMYHPTADETQFNLVTLPIFHAYGLCAGIHAPLIIGYSEVIVPQFSVKKVFAVLKKYNITVWSIVPAMVKKMLDGNRFDNKKALSSLDVIWCGGDTLDESLVEKVNGILKKYCPRAKLMRGYGLTEVCGVCIVNSYERFRKDSCGVPMSTAEVAVWNDDDKPVPIGELGEIVISSDGNMQGYVEGENCFAEYDGKQWVKTGDIGYLDADGFVYVVDRKKRSLKIAAVNVFPSQVESCVKKLDFIDDACTVGVKVQGKQFVKVFVTLKEPKNAADVEVAVKQVCSENLIRYSVPRFVEVLEKMPRTPLGKVDYKCLQELCDKQST